MTNSTLNITARKMFESRRNVLLSNISFKYHSEANFDFSLLDKILPAFGTWRKDKDISAISENTIVTLCCTNQVTAPVTSLGKIDVGVPMFEHEMYLVQSYTLAGTNISMLRTTAALLTNKDFTELVSGHFENVILLDFIPWRTETFRRYYTGLQDVAFSVALMDGFSKVASTEADTRKSEIEEVAKAYYKEDHVRSRCINKCFDYSDFAILTSVVNPLRIGHENSLKKQLESLVFYFGKDGIWGFKWNFIGKLELGQCPKVDDVVTTASNVLTMLLKGDGGLMVFEKLFPDWRHHLMESLRPIFKANRLSTSSVEKINNTVSIHFADYIRTQINNFIK